MSILQAATLIGLGIGITALGWFVLEVVLSVYDRCTRRKDPRA